MSLHNRLEAKSALPPRQAMMLARDLLLAEGLEEVARSATRDSLYFRRTGCAHQLRISNHRRTMRRRRQYREVVHSLVVDQPRSRAQMVALIRQALQAYDRASDRRPRHPEVECAPPPDQSRI